MSSPLTLHVVAAELMPASQRQAVIELCAAAYVFDFGSLFSDFPGSRHVLAYRDERLVSHAAWVTRWLQPPGYPPLRTAYVEAVATAPAYQGQGYASAVMRHLVANVEDYTLAALSPSDPAFYERLGWELWRGPLAIRTESGLMATPGERVMLFPLPSTPALDFSSQLTAEWRPGELW